VLKLYKGLLAPLLLAQGARLRRSALRLPEAAGQRAGQIEGRNDVPPIRLLFVGDSSAAGVGVAHQSEGLALPCAMSLQRRTGRSVEWQLVAKSGINTAEAAAMLQQHSLGPADAIITVLGVNDVTSQTTPGKFLTDYRALIEQLQARTGARVAVVSGLPPMNAFSAIPNPLRWYLGKYARRLDARLRAWIATQPRLRHLPLKQSTVAGALARDGYHPGPEQYRRWAEQVAQCLAEMLQRTTPRGPASQAEQASHATRDELR